MTFRTQSRVPAHWASLILALGAMGPLRAADAPIPVAAATASTQLTGEVTVVNTQTRMMTIKTPSGVYEVLNIPEGVKGIDEIHTGDEVTITASEAVLLDVKKGEQAGPGGTLAERTVASAPGETPSATVVDKVTLYGKVVDVDRTSSTVTIQGSEGTIALKVRDPALLSDLAAGDGVVAHYARVVTGEIQH